MLIFKTNHFTLTLIIPYCKGGGAVDFHNKKSSPNSKNAEASW